MPVRTVLGARLPNFSAIIFGLALVATGQGAEAQQGRLGIGLGLPYGGFLGARYSVPVNEGAQLYLGAGLLAYTANDGAWAGYTIGFDQQIMNSRHSWGLSTGTVAAGSWAIGKATYYGIGANYLYHFRAFSVRSGLVGLSAFIGEADRYHPLGSQRVNGYNVIFGYQF